VRTSERYTQAWLSCGFLPHISLRGDRSWSHVPRTVTGHRCQGPVSPRTHFSWPLVPCVVSCNSLSFDPTFTSHQHTYTPGWSETQNIPLETWSPCQSTSALSYHHRKAACLFLYHQSQPIIQRLYMELGSLYLLSPEGIPSGVLAKQCGHQLPCVESCTGH
jgi:hypothetical protein